MRRATARRASRQQPAGISIHALLAESDQELFRIVKPSYNFYPRSPCGERRNWTHWPTKHLLFLSTLSLRRATRLCLLGWLRTLISIHALLAESDVGQKRLRQKLAISIHALLAESDDTISQSGCALPKFLSTLSLRRATPTNWFDLWGWAISIHALLAESDSLPAFRICPPRDFYPRSPCGERRLDGRFKL